MKLWKAVEQCGKSWGDFLTIEAETIEEAAEKLGADAVCTIYDRPPYRFGGKIFELRPVNENYPVRIIHIPNDR